MSASEPGTQVGVLRRTGELGRLVRLWAEAAQGTAPNLPEALTLEKVEP